MGFDHVFFFWLDLPNSSTHIKKVEWYISSLSKSKGPLIKKALKVAVKAVHCVVSDL